MLGSSPLLLIARLGAVHRRKKGECRKRDTNHVTQKRQEIDEISRPDEGWSPQIWSTAVIRWRKVPEWWHGGLNRALHYPALYSAIYVPQPTSRCGVLLLVQPLICWPKLRVWRVFPRLELAVRMHTLPVLCAWTLNQLSVNITSQAQGSWDRILT